VFTIHNLAYQGNYGQEVLDSLELPWHLGTPGAWSSTAGSAT